MAFGAGLATGEIRGAPGHLGACEKAQAQC